MKFKVLKDSRLESSAKAGTFVYACRHADYGCASDDTRATGIEHISVTLDVNGNYPFFTMPRPDLERVDAS